MRLRLTAGAWTVPQHPLDRLSTIRASVWILKAQGNTMATSSILGGSKAPEEISGKDVHALGPSDNSDSGSDAVGAYGDEELSSDSDAVGTGERASAGLGLGRDQTDADVMPDHIETAPGADADTDVDGDAGDDFNDLSEVEELADDSENLDIDAQVDDDEAASGSR